MDHSSSSNRQMRLRLASTAKNQKCFQTSFVARALCWAGMFYAIVVCIILLDVSEYWALLYTPELFLPSLKPDRQMRYTKPFKSPIKMKTQACRSPQSLMR